MGLGLRRDLDMQITFCKAWAFLFYSLLFSFTTTKSMSAAIMIHLFL